MGCPALLWSVKKTLLRTYTFLVIYVLSGPSGPLLTLSGGMRETWREEVEERGLVQEARGVDR